MKGTLVVLALLLAACSAAVPIPESEQPDPTPSPARYTDAEQAEILAESITLVHGTDPQPEWYPAFVTLAVEDRWAYVTTTLSFDDTDLADSMCRDIASITFDDEAEPIGVTDVLIFAEDGTDLVDCDVPEL